MVTSDMKQEQKLIEEFKYNTEKLSEEYDMLL